MDPILIDVLQRSRCETACAPQELIHLEQELNDDESGGDEEEEQEDRADDEGDESEHRVMRKDKKRRIVKADMRSPPDKISIVTARIEEFRVPDGYLRAPVPEKQPGRSVIYDYGVKVLAVADVKEAAAAQAAESKKRKKATKKEKIKPKSHSMSYRWYCLASEECTKACSGGGVFIKGIGNKTSNCTDHLKQFHSIVSEKTCKHEVLPAFSRLVCIY